MRGLLRVLCPVRRPITAPDCVLLKDKYLVFLVGLVPEVSFRACLWVLLRSRHITKCWLSTQLYILLFIFCPPKDGWGPTNFWTEPALARLSPISFPRTLPCPVNQYNPYSAPVRDTIPRFLALSHQWRRCFGSLKCFQSRLNIRANTNLFLWPNRS